MAQVMTKVRISGCGTVLEVDEGDDLLRALQAVGHPISTSCGGRASCGLCRLTVVSGSELLSPLRAEEVLHLGNVARLIGARLACQARVCGQGELEVDVPAVDNVELRKRAKAERMARQKLEAPALPVDAPPPRGVERSAKIEWRPRKLEAPPKPGPVSLPQGPRGRGSKGGGPGQGGGGSAGGR